MGVKVNDDLQKERDKCSFDVNELINCLDGGAKFTEFRRKMLNYVLDREELRDKIPEEYLSHKENYENSIRKDVLLHKILQKIDDNEKPEFEKIKSYTYLLLILALFKQSNPMSLHNGMFVPVLEGQGTEKQKAYWLKRANNFEIIGTYAQTELGHGTFIRGLETTATYDPKTEEFIIHSPVISSYKWWPGSLGHTSNYAVVMAQLYTKGHHCGMQPFIVQLRDENTHTPLPGIKVGEIGPKLGFNSANNGFLGFDQYRIPRDWMLMKNAQVLKDGTFKASRNSKLTYGTMVLVRVAIVRNMSVFLSKAVTIAIRYSAVRRQSLLKPNEPEPQIMDYLTQQHKLFIAIATTHAINLTSIWLWDKYTNFTKGLAEGKTDDLPELHSLSCCLKAVSSSDCSSLVEKCRLACGGHGYMLSSNLPFIYGSTTAACTYEGENTVLMLQTARSLIKALEQVHEGGNLPASMAYLKDKSPLKNWDSSVEGIVRNFQRVASGKLTTCATTLQRYVKSGCSLEDAWNMSSVQLVAAAEAHCRALILSTYKSQVELLVAAASDSLKEVLTQLVQLYAVYWSLERLGDLLLYCAITESDIQELQKNYEDLLVKIRPNAVGLVDGFDLRDEILRSTLGAYDGRVYERLMEEALKSPLNADPVNRSFHQYIKPFMQGKL